MERRITTEIGSDRYLRVLGLSRIFLDKFYSSIKKSQRLNDIKTLIKQKDLSGLLKLVEKKNHQYFL